jgi:hypothetical protein
MAHWLNPENDWIVHVGAEQLFPYKWVLVAERGLEQARLLVMTTHTLSPQFILVQKILALNPTATPFLYH